MRYACTHFKPFLVIVLNVVVILQSTSSWLSSSSVTSKIHYQCVICIWLEITEYQTLIAENIPVQISLRSDEFL